MPTPLNDKVVVVTGSSSGIGRRIAIECAKCGADVVVHGCNNLEGAERLAQEIRQIGRQACIEMCDISNSSLQAEFVQKCWNWKGRVDAWINNAGADVLTGDAANLTYQEKLQRLWEVDVLGTIGLSNEIGKWMTSAADGVSSATDLVSQTDIDNPGSGGLTRRSIINIGWDQAEVGMSGDSGEIFATTKGAIMAYTRSLARTLAPHVRVNCVAPGWIKTAWGDNASDYWQSRAIKESLLERWGSPQDVASTVRFLISDEGSFISGQVINVNGGYRGESLS